MFSKTRVHLAKTESIALVFLKQKKKNPVSQNHDK